MEKYYRFKDTVIKICSEEELCVPENMKKFENEVQENAYEYVVEISDELEQIVNRFKEEHPDCKTVCRENMKIFYTEDQELREVYLMGSEVPYAVTIEEEKTQIWVTSKILSMLSIDTVFGSLLGLEKRVLKEDGLILHSSFVCKEGKAILFTAPSGTGKSTQADLWEKYKGTRTINGDRTLVKYQDGRWWACGWPICGSSEICFNESYPLDAIIVLHQAKENAGHRIHGFEVIRNLLRETTVNRWNLSFYDRMIALLERMEKEISVYDYKCDISKEAVEQLEQLMKTEKINSIDAYI